MSSKCITELASVLKCFQKDWSYVEFAEEVLLFSIIFVLVWRVIPCLCNVGKRSVTNLRWLNWLLGWASSMKALPISGVFIVLLFWLGLMIKYSLTVTSIKKYCDFINSHSKMMRDWLLAKTFSVAHCWAILHAPCPASGNKSTSLEVLYLVEVRSIIAGHFAAFLYFVRKISFCGSNVIDTPAAIAFREYLMFKEVWLVSGPLPDLCKVVLM